MTTTPDEYMTMQLTDLADVYGPAAVLATATVLFAPPLPSSPSRTSDPETSHASGDRRATRDVRRFSSGSLPGKLLHTFAAAPDGLTAIEAALAMTGTLSLHRVESARKRVSDLHAAGYLVDTGTRRSNPGSADMAVVWKLSLAGEVANEAMGRTGWTRAAA